WGAAGRGWEGGGRVVAKIDFADGFDAPEPLAWGLTPAQLGTVVAGAVLAYLCLHAPLPRIVAVPLALVAASAGLTLALARRDGRTLISWAAAAARFWTRPRRGLLVVVQAAQPPDPTRTQDSPHRREPVLLDREDAVRPSPARLRWEPGDEVETSRRVPLVLLPEPLTAARERGAEAVPAGSRPLPVLGVADAALLEVPAARGPEPGVASRTASPSGADPGWIETGPPPAPRVTRRLTFFSLSGGSGRTTLAVEVAGLLAGPTHPGNAWGMLVPPRVVLVDLDLTSPRAAIRLGLPAPTEWSLAEGGPVGSEVARLPSVHRSGLLLLPRPAGVLPAGSCDRADVVNRLAAAA